MSHQGAHVPIAGARYRIADPLQIIEDQATNLRNELLGLERMSLVQVCPDQFKFAIRERRHIVHVDAAHFKFQGGREVTLIELPITGHIVVRIALRIRIVHTGVRPVAVQFTIVAITRPSADVFRMAIRRQVARIRHRNMSDEVNSTDTGRSSIVLGLDQAPHGIHGC